MAHTSDSVTGQLKKVIYDLAQTAVNAQIPIPGLVRQEMP